eukprot:m.468159 g.468159  ORF g.468159 m.468159 type:complete len:254 (+) comp57070_c0_seq16:1425-2186(+)
MLRPSSKQAQIFRCVTVMVSHACITRHLEGNPKCCAFCCKPTPRISTRRTEFVLPSGFPGSTIVTVFAAVCLRYSSSSQRGATALMLACYLAHAIELGEGRKMIIKLLLEAGADIFLQNKDGETAKDVLGQDRPEILRIFQEHEEYLSKIGSRTKPALRAVAPAALSQDSAEVIDAVLRPCSARFQLRSLRSRFSWFFPRDRFSAAVGRAARPEPAWLESTHEFEDLVFLLQAAPLGLMLSSDLPIAGRSICL